MNLRLFALALLLAAPLAHADSAKALSSAPHAYHQDGTCYVRGAVWSNGPVANARLTLEEVGGTGAVEVQTDALGFYEAQVAVSEGATLQERLSPETRRAAVRVGSRLPTVFEPRMVCRRGNVAVGAIEVAPVP
jgi:hypothetical protein